MNERLIERMSNTTDKNKDKIMSADKDRSELGGSV